MVSPNNNSPDIRKWNSRERRNLGAGNDVEVVDFNGLWLCHMPPAMFLSISSMPELLKDGKVQLSSPITNPDLKQPFRYLARHLAKLTADNVPMFDSAYHNIHISHAVDLLGMRWNTGHIFAHYSAILESATLNWEDLVNIVQSNVPPTHRLFRQASYQLARKIYESETPGDFHLNKFLALNSCFNKTWLKLSTTWKEAEEREKRAKASKERHIKAMVIRKAKETKTAATRKEAQAILEQKDREKEQAERELRAPVVEKRRQENKLDHAETSMAYDMLSKAVLV